MKSLDLILLDEAPPRIRERFPHHIAVLPR